MPVGQSADGLKRAFRVRPVVRPAFFSPGGKLLLLGLNAWPFFHALLAAAILVLIPASIWERSGMALAWLLAVPPLLCRFVVGAGLPTGEFRVPSSAFFRWWATWQLQALFNRFPGIEEGFRIVPGLYSLWLRLWGSRIGRLTVWSPGVRLYDRPLVRIGDEVVVGIGAQFVGHLVGLDAQGRTSLALGPVTIGDRTLVGGSAFLGAGFILDSDQATEALFLGLPFTRWRAGERVPNSDTFPPSTRTSL